MKQFYIQYLDVVIDESYHKTKQSNFRLPLGIFTILPPR